MGERTSAQASTTARAAGIPRQSLQIEHPVINNKIWLPTPSIRAAFEVIANTALERSPGVSFYGSSRVGKTSAILVLREQLAQVFPDIPTMTVNAKWHPRFSETIFFGEMLTAVAHVMSAPAKVEVRRGRVVKLLWTSAMAVRSDRLVLFVDEAQCWLDAALTMLRDLANDLLLEHKIQLIVVLFGTPELLSVHTSLLHAGREDLVGRFMPQRHAFRGITDCDQLRSTMQFYDDPEVSQYPDGSGLSYSECLLPIAYRSGWRLENEAPLLWEQYRRMALGKGGLSEVGMQWINASIRDFFQQHISFDHADLHGEADQWLDAVRRSGFETSLGNPNTLSH